MPPLISVVSVLLPQGCLFLPVFSSLRNWFPPLFPGRKTETPRLQTLPKHLFYFYLLAFLRHKPQDSWFKSSSVTTTMLCYKLEMSSHMLQSDSLPRSFFPPNKWTPRHPRVSLVRILLVFLLLYAITTSTNYFGFFSKEVSISFGNVQKQIEMQSERGASSLLDSETWPIWEFTIV